jgi:hypothetical protein
MGTETPAKVRASFTGREVLDLIAVVETKAHGPNEQLTLLTLAISLVAINSGVRLRDLRRGLEQSFRNTVRATPRLSAARGIEDEH